MQVTIELSLYPLRENYKEIILDFIKHLRAYEEIEVFTTEMSTYVKGEWNAVIPILQKELGSIYEADDASSTVLKIIPQELPVEDGFRTF